MALSKAVDDLHRLHLKGRAAVLAEHGDHGVEHHLGLGQVGGRTLNEHVTGVEGDLKEHTGTAKGTSPIRQYRGRLHQYHHQAVQGPAASALSSNAAGCVDLHASLTRSHRLSRPQGGTTNQQSITPFK